MTAPAFLIDTHVLLWLDAEPERLSEHILGLLRDPRHAVYCSAASLWEIAIKQNVGKLRVEGSLPEMIGRYGFRELPVTARDAENTRGLPLHHRDPFDRMLVAQAMAGNLVLVSGDRQMLAYEIPVLSC
ncbi:MAG TPA: type II toxin-antitoxin system VapC family toxin [Acidobacteriaceae bacterium]|nr:type II toxin-antitoxin system VapC family toxin [Acidobacteriaceae bacterium]